MEEGLFLDTIMTPSHILFKPQNSKKNEGGFTSRLEDGSQPYLFYPIENYFEILMLLLNYQPIFLELIYWLEKTPYKKFLEISKITLVKLSVVLHFKSDHYCETAREVKRKYLLVPKIYWYLYNSRRIIYQIAEKVKN